MTPQPNPTRRMATIETPERVGRLRKLDCRHYDRCLSLAGAKQPDARRGWASFTCINCEVDDLVPLERASISGGISLLAEIAEERGSKERGPHYNFGRELRASHDGEEFHVR